MLPLPHYVPFPCRRTTSTGALVTANTNLRPDWLSQILSVPFKATLTKLTNGHPRRPHLGLAHMSRAGTIRVPLHPARPLVLLQAPRLRRRRHHLDRGRRRDRHERRRSRLRLYSSTTCARDVVSTTTAPLQRHSHSALVHRPQRQLKHPSLVYFKWTSHLSQHQSTGAKWSQAEQK